MVAEDGFIDNLQSVLEYTSWWYGNCSGRGMKCYFYRPPRFALSFPLKPLCSAILQEALCALILLYFAHKCPITSAFKERHEKITMRHAHAVFD